MSESRAPELYFDADCALCTRTAWFIDRRDRRKTLRMLSLQGPEGEALRAAHPWLRGVDSLVWVDADASAARVLVHSSAVLEVGRYLGGTWGLLARLGRVVPTRLRDALYRWLARHRRRIPV